MTPGLSSSLSATGTPSRKTTVTISSWSRTKLSRWPPPVLCDFARPAASAIRDCSTARREPWFSLATTQALFLLSTFRVDHLRIAHELVEEADQDRVGDAAVAGNEVGIDREDPERVR